MSDGDADGAPPPTVSSWERDRPGLILLTSHWLTWIGLTLVITAISSWLFIRPAEHVAHAENPYAGLVVYVFLPIVFFTGGVLAGIGMLLARRRIRARLQAGIHDRGTALRRLIVFLVVAVGGNLLLGTQVTYRAVEYMDTPQFCGTTCHVMRPEYIGHRDSVHASVACADCHVAPGAGGWVEAKMNGTRQLWQVLTNTYPRPIPSALETNRLVPSRETCERCHWADKIVATRLLVLPTYASDERNSDSYTVLMMLVGGSRMGGIHYAHFAGGFEVRYAASDAKRQTIPWVERRNLRTGEVTTYLASGTSVEGAAALPNYAMQCVDCHNRPTHAFSPPDRAFDRALALGDVPSTLPFIKKEGLAVLKATYTSNADAAEKIPAAIDAYYRTSHPGVYAERHGDVAKAATGVLAIYARNTFPELHVDSGTYPNDLGHTDSPGCFRCHDGSHTTADGKESISQDCGVCHQLLAVGESTPEILKTLGLWDRIEALKQHPPGTGAQ